LIGEKEPPGQETVLKVEPWKYKNFWKEVRKCQESNEASRPDMGEIRC